MAGDPTIVAGVFRQETVIAGTGRERTVIAGPPGPPPADDEDDGPLSRPPAPRERLEFALPTINVIFLLMLYFLIAGTIVQNDELSVVPPVTAETPTDRLPRPLLVVNGDGGFMLDGRPLSRQELVLAAAEVVARSQGQALNVLAPAEMAAGPFLEIINAFAASSIPVRIVMIDRSGLRTPSQAGANP